MTKIESGSFEQYLPDNDKEPSEQGNEAESESVWMRWRKPDWQKNGYENIAGEFRQYVIDKNTYTGEYAQLFDQFLVNGVTPGDILAYKDGDIRTNGELPEFEKEIKDKPSLQLVKDALGFLGKEVTASFEASQVQRKFASIKADKNKRDILMLGETDYYPKVLAADSARTKKNTVVAELERRLLPERLSPEARRERKFLKKYRKYG